MSPAPQKCRSIFFTQDVRVARRVSGRQGEPATRVSLVELQNDPRREVHITVGVEATIYDKIERTVIHVPYHIVREWELLDEPIVAAQPTEPETPKAKSEPARKVPATLA